MGLTHNRTTVRRDFYIAILSPASFHGKSHSEQLGAKLESCPRDFIGHLDLPLGPY